MVAEAPLLVHSLAASLRRGEMHQANGLLRAAAIRPGDAGDRDRDVGPAVRERAFGHRARDLLRSPRHAWRSGRRGTPSISIFASFE